VPRPRQIRHPLGRLALQYGVLLLAGGAAPHQAEDGRMTSCGGSSPGRTPREGSMNPVYLLGLSKGYFVVYNRSLENKSKF